MEKDKVLTPEVRVSDISYKDQETGTEYTVYVDDKIKDIEKEKTKTVHLNNNELDKISTMMGLGMTIKDVANVYEIPIGLLKKMTDESESLKSAIHKGRANSKMKVLHSLYKEVVSGNSPHLAIQWLYSFGDLTSHNNMKMKDGDGSQKTVDSFSPVERRELILELSQTINRAGIITREESIRLNKEAIEHTLDAELYDEIKDD